MIDKSKRFFCRNYFFQLAGRVVKEFDTGLNEAREAQDFDSFFESYDSSYALTLAYPDDIVIETARQHNIETEGRDKKEIVKELFEQFGGYGDRYR